MSEDSTQNFNLPQFLSQFQNAKGHFVSSQREMLLGMREICRILSDILAASPNLLGWEVPGYAIKTVEAVLDYLIARIPEHGKPHDILVAKIKAIDELLEILDQEAQRVGKAAKSETDLAKVEAIISIKKYLNVEREAAKHQKENPDKSQRIRKVVIE